MHAREIVASLCARQGVVGAVLADRRGTIVAEQGSTNPEALAASTAFVLACATKVGDALALGEPLYVKASSGPRRLGLINGNQTVSTVEASSSAAVEAACQEARAMLHE